jgi:hypothetical protein
VHSAGVSLGEVTHVALRHGTGTVGEPDLVVDTLYGEQRAPGDAVFHAALHLEANGGGAGAGARPERRWRQVSIEVAGREQIFWLGEEGERWAAFARVGRVRVVLVATRWDRAGVRLAVAERDAYLGGPAAGSTTSR